jgi:hypothetical protein
MLWNYHDIIIITAIWIALIIAVTAFVLWAIDR